MTNQAAFIIWDFLVNLYLV